VLPLVDVVPEVAKEHGSSTEVITRHQPEIWTFLLSFVVIMRLWRAHHHTFEHVRAYSVPLMLCNSGWLLAIIVVPFPTEMVGVYGGDRFTVGLYISTILVANALQTAMNLIVRADPDVASETNPVTPEFATASVTATALLAVALVLALTVPGINYWALLVLGLSPVVEWAWLRHRAGASGSQERETSGEASSSI
jgi:uncharacterized membrane protein